MGNCFIYKPPDRYSMYGLQKPNSVEEYIESYPGNDDEEDYQPSIASKSNFVTPKFDATVNSFPAQYTQSNDSSDALDNDNLSLKATVPSNHNLHNNSHMHHHHHHHQHSKHSENHRHQNPEILKDLQFPEKSSQQDSHHHNAEGHNHKHIHQHHSHSHRNHNHVNTEGDNGIHHRKQKIPEHNPSKLLETQFNLDKKDFTPVHTTKPVPILSTLDKENLLPTIFESTAKTSDTHQSQKLFKKPPTLISTIPHKICGDFPPNSIIRPSPVYGGNSQMNPDSPRNQKRADETKMPNSSNQNKVIISCVIEPKSKHETFHRKPKNIFRALRNRLNRNRSVNNCTLKRSPVHIFSLPDDNNYSLDNKYSEDLRQNTDDNILDDENSLPTYRDHHFQLIRNSTLEEAYLRNRINPDGDEFFIRAEEARRLGRDDNHEQDRHHQDYLKVEQPTYYDISPSRTRSHTPSLESIEDSIVEENNSEDENVTQDEVDIDEYMIEPSAPPLQNDLRSNNRYHDANISVYSDNINEENQSVSNSENVSCSTRYSYSDDPDWSSLSRVASHQAQSLEHSSQNSQSLTDDEEEIKEVIEIEESECCSALSSCSRCISECEQCQSEIECNSNRGSRTSC